ncbi:putative leucine-rich repeat domain superfamily [Helianthus annuus]|uniref:Leucine-rich repeat domain superfamily n=1 Tax=Helianthus annuus TaxID=4232 RepID=A0A9K3J6G7_HELAN|nr:putative leucine-rich repeat domain superfamily [Helianthus annuus]KAJ0930797.1 putative leucine-rich repeat domain superfamily, transport inhibitor response 1 [Helianthus annuus]
MSEDNSGGGKVRNSVSGAGTITGTVAGEYFTAYPDQVLENVIENVLVFLTSRRDRSAVSLVCKSWYRAEAHTRSDLFIGNCYAIAPKRVTDRFKRIRSIALKGKPRFADFSLLPVDWGAYFTPWAHAMANAYRALEKIYLKRMLVTDDDLAVIAHSFVNFKEIVLVCCEGFGTTGLALVASHCRNLRVLELIEDDVSVSVDEVDWISCFPAEGTTNLESLCFDCVEAEVNFDALERLVARSPLLKKLKLNTPVSIQELYKLIVRAPQLTHLGTGSFNPLVEINQQQGDHQEPDYAAAFAACKSIVCLSGFREIAPEYFPTIVPLCGNLTSLNLSFANVNAEQFKPVIRHCHKLQVFWAFDTICDEGLQAVADTCKDLREKLQSILYFCQQMTNAAVIAMSKNCPDLVVFRLCIIGRYRPDRVTGEPMDEGFGAIVKNCTKLTRLAVSGMLTDRAFSYIGQYGKLVRTLSVAFNGDSDNGLKYVLEGCTNLQKLEIRDCPFGDSGLQSGLHRFYDMRFVWMSSCRVTRQGCLEVARRLPKLRVEVFRRDEEEGERGDFVETLYMYRSLDGPRPDAPQFVEIL